jgi:hypothetical protein
VVDDLVAGAVELGSQASFGNGHPDGAGDPLAEGSGGRLDPRRGAVLRVARRPRPELAEAPQLVEWKVVAAQVKERVEERGGMPCRQDEPVAIRPAGDRRGVLEEPRPQHVCHRRCAHGRAGVTAVRGLHGVDREGADGRDRELVELGRDCGHRALVLGLASWTTGPAYYSRAPAAA